MYLLVHQKWNRRRTTGNKICSSTRLRELTLGLLQHRSQLTQPRRTLLETVWLVNDAAVGDSLETRCRSNDWYFQWPYGWKYLEFGLQRVSGEAPPAPSLTDHKGLFFLFFMRKLSFFYCIKDWCRKKRLNKLVFYYCI